MYELASYPLLPIIKLLGVDYMNLNLYSRVSGGVDIFTKGVMRFSKAICSFKFHLPIFLPSLKNIEPH